MPAGRPSKYEASHPDRAYKLALLGLTDEEVANAFGIHISTLYDWDKKHKEFPEARARGREQADAEVANRLYMRAIGYSHDAVKIFQYGGGPVTVPYIEHYPPDTQAATWWLKNRHPDKWRDRQEITGKDGAPLIEAPHQIVNVIDAAFTRIEPVLIEGKTDGEAE